MQNYTKIQKYTSFLLIFSILFSFTINISFFSFLWKLFASDGTNYNLVSILVREDIYSSIENQIKRYATDIQWVLENTKTIIIPVPINTHPFNMASLNEKLYFEWYDWLSWQSWKSKLIWTVIVWDLPLPVVENNWNYEKTILPYVDFDDKLYIYNHSEKKYKLNDDFSNEPKAEIWHGFIGWKWVNITDLIWYFDKNHAFYTWWWNFNSSKWILNWKESDGIPTKYEPYVFYFDQIRESKAVKYVEYKAYEGYLDNIEDIIKNKVK